MATFAEHSRALLLRLVKAPPLQHMTVGVAAAAAISLLLLSPHIDMAAAQVFYSGDGHFVGEGSAAVRILRNLFIALYAAACIAAVIGLFVTRDLSREWQSLAFSQWLFLAVCLGTGPGIVSNLATKDQWGRARPSQIVEFGGAKSFSPVFVPSDQCLRNCSFVSGEASSMFALFFAGAFTWRNYRRELIAAGIAAGTTAGLVRMMQGAHFLTDVVFAAIFMAMTVAVIRFIFDAIATSAQSSSRAEAQQNPSAL